MNVLKAPQDKVFAVFQAVSGIVERRHTVPILANVLIRKMGHAVQLTTSDGEIQIRTTTELGGDAGEFATTVGARKLIDILKTVPGEQTVSLEGAQGRVVLKAGKSRFTLQTLPAQDFPLVQESPAFGPAFSVPQKTLKHLLAQQREAYAPDHLPTGVLTVTAGVDTQKDRLEIELVGWGAGEESWGIEHIVLHGNPAEPALWQQLDGLLINTRLP